MMKRGLVQLALLTVLSVMVAGQALAAEEFVLRKEYPGVKYITTEDLNQEYDTAIIVDVRSKIEFDVVHIGKALHIPVSQGNFVSEIEKLRSKDGDDPIAFYCNGYTCAKSYKAAEKMMAAGYTNVYTYDAGIYEWVNAHPEKAALMGKTPADKAKLISSEAFKAKQIDYADFAAKAKDADALVIDIREPFQRAQNPTLPQNKMLVLENVRNIPSDRLVSLLQKGEFKDKTLLITDAVGKQVQWLQYYLEDGGYKNYFFLKKGVLGASEAGGVK